MSKSKQTMIVHHAPQVVAMAIAAIGRLEKLLTICDFQIDALQVKINNPKEVSHRELLSLARMVLNIQKDLDKYASIIYPATTEFCPTIGISSENNYSNFDSTIEVERDSINDNIETTTRKTNEISHNRQSPDAHDTTRSHYASKPKHNSNSQVEITSPSCGVTLQEEPVLLSRKKSTKNQKFSHSFFQNRAQK